jgi:hypothetical protein
MCVTTGEDCGKAEVLFQAISDNFSQDSITWQNVIAVGLDNTNTNVGCNNSIKTIATCLTLLLLKELMHLVVLPDLILKIMRLTFITTFVRALSERVSCLIFWT